MLSKLKIKLLTVVAVLGFVAPGVIAPVAVLAQSPTIQNSLCTGANTLQLTNGTNGASNSSCASGNGVSSFNNILSKAINIISVIVGVIAVIMIIVGGFRYITSGGDTTKVSSAKTTILYALIGLVIVAIAQIIVKFVLDQATQI